MKIKFISIWFMLSLVLVGGCQAGQAQQTNKTPQKTIETKKYSPIFLFEPQKLELAYPDSGKFVSGRITVTNPSDSTLKIYNIKASCYCGFSVVLDNSIEPGKQGYIEFTINIEGLEDSNWVSFIVKSNAENSPVEVPVYVLKKDSAKPKKACELKGK